MHFCPNCSAEVAVNAIACPTCEADFSDPEGWKPQTAPTKASTRWKASSLAVFYGIVGPPLGALIFCILLAILAPFYILGSFEGITSTGRAFAGLLFMAMLGCYQLGAVPAAMTGILHALLRRGIESRWKHILTLAAAASVVQYIYTIAVVAMFSRYGTTPSLSIGLQHLVAALTAAALAAFVTQRERVEA
jgi:hypothetical protein